MLTVLRIYMLHYAFLKTQEKTPTPLPSHNGPLSTKATFLCPQNDMPLPVRIFFNLIPNAGRAYVFTPSRRQFQNGIWVLWRC